MTGDEIRQVSFHEARRGYRPKDVDRLIEQLAAAADRGEPVADLARAAAFREAKRAYNMAEVDAFLERVIASG